jgi:hypothetical protein
VGALGRTSSSSSSWRARFLAVGLDVRPALVIVKGLRASLTAEWRRLMADAGAGASGGRALADEDTCLSTILDGPELEGVGGIEAADRGRALLGVIATGLSVWGVGAPVRELAVPLSLIFNDGLVPPGSAEPASDGLRDPSPGAMFTTSRQAGPAATVKLSPGLTSSH